MSHTMRRLAFASLLATLLLALPRGSQAWEAATTHAGLTERAAMSSRLHTRLRDDLGLDRGLFSALIVPPADAPALFAVLTTMNPIHGYVPDSRGRLLALGWLAAGSAIADVPAVFAGNHFFDPTGPVAGQGLSDSTVSGLGMRLRNRVYTSRAGESVVRDGIPAPDWLLHPDNPMNVDGFLDQYAKAVQARTPAERGRHIAGALMAAGAVLHVLQDMGSPSHVRNDLAAHLDVVGNDRFDVGSRFERVAALAYGRLGVPAAAQPVTASSVRGFFAAPDGSGLADRTATSWFSAYTLPGSVRLRPGTGSSAIRDQLMSTLPRPLPAPSSRLNLDAAHDASGAVLANTAGVCLAKYRVRDSMLEWYMDDDCIADQLAAILPQVAAYSTGLLDWLFRGAITLERSQSGISARAAGADFGKGTIELFWDDGRGIRTAVGQPVPVDSAESGAILIPSLPRPPADARALAVLFRGLDRAGQPLLAPGYIALR